MSAEIKKVDLAIGAVRRLANGDVVRAVEDDDCDACYFGRRGRCELVEYWRATREWFQCLDYERRDGRRVIFEPVDGLASKLVRTPLGLTLLCDRPLGFSDSPPHNLR